MKKWYLMCYDKLNMTGWKALLSPVDIKTFSNKSINTNHISFKDGFYDEKCVLRFCPSEHMQKRILPKCHLIFFYFSIKEPEKSQVIIWLYKPVFLTRNEQFFILTNETKFMLSSFLQRAGENRHQVWTVTRTDPSVFLPLRWELSGARPDLWPAVRS